MGRVEEGAEGKDREKRSGEHERTFEKRTQPRKGTARFYVSI